MKAIVENIRQAGALIEKVLDSKITDNEHLEGHPDCEITVKYDVLIPEVRCDIHKMFSIINYEMIMVLQNGRSLTDIRPEKAYES